MDMNYEYSDSNEIVSDNEAEIIEIQKKMHKTYRRRSNTLQEIEHSNPDSDICFLHNEQEPGKEERAYVL